MLRYRINSTAGKKGDAVTQKGHHLQQLIDSGIVYDTKVVNPDTKSGNESDKKEDPKQKSESKKTTKKTTKKKSKKKKGGE